MEEREKIVIIESEEEDKDPPMHVKEVVPEEDPIRLVWRPKYAPPSKGKAKLLANLDEVNSIIIAQSLPKVVLVENSVIGYVVTMKFEDWDLVDIVKFPHLATDELMDQKIEGTVTTLQPKEWL